MFLRSRIGVLAATLCLIGASAAALVYVNATKPQPGLQASVFRNPDFAGMPISAATDLSLSVDDRARAAGLPDSEPFSVDWTGWVFIERTGAYHYKLEVDDGAVIWIDGRPLVDVTGPPGTYTRLGTAQLERGVYPIQIRYKQFLGARQFKFTWSKPSDRYELVPPTYFLPGETPLTLTAVALAQRLPLAVALTWSAWIAAMLAWPFWRAAGLGRPWRGLTRRELILGGAVLGTCLVLMAANITWGMFPFRAWHPEELTPGDIANAASVRFSHGWNHIYPPLHFVLSALVMAPVILGEQARVLSYDQTVLGAFHLGERLISLGMGVLTLVMAFMIGRLTIGRSRALAAVGIAGASQLFTFYSKTANVDVPYVMWVTAAALFYVRAAKYQRLPDFVRLGAAAACAIATKDQAFGFFAGPAAVLLWFSWRHTAGSPGAVQRVVRTATDARLWAGLITFGVALAIGYGIPWNYAGFRSHVETALGWRTAYFRMFDNSLAGQASLLVLSLRLLPWVLGVVPTAMALAGVWVALTRRRRFRWLWVLMVPIVSYYVTVVMTLGYVYDRFVLAWLIAGAQLAVLGIDRIVRSPRLSPALRLTVAAACITAAIVPAAYLNIEMALGSRHRLERWLAANAGNNPLLLATGNALYLPSLADYRHVVVDTPDDRIAEWQADIIVLNEDWLKRFDTLRPVVAAALAKASYAEVFRDLPAPRPWWVAAFTGRPPREDVTNLTKVSPAYSVWQKIGRAP